jgi:hypothetical protein
LKKNARSPLDRIPGNPDSSYFSSICLIMLKAAPRSRHLTTRITFKA